MHLAHIVSVSGGKDSQAVLHLALERIGADFTAVFADTGHEHDDTYRHIEYLNEQVHPIRIVRLSQEWLDRMIKRKRMFIARDQRTRRDHRGRRLRWSNKAKRRALEVLHPTGNQFLDLCLYHGRFPSTRGRFCSQELKHAPLREQVVEPLLADGYTVVSWQGVRAEESRTRAALPLIDEPEDGLIVYRPIITWSAAEVFDYIKASGYRYNPLYEKGMGRVGCMPCIHARKDELRQIAQRFPEHIERLAEWEARVSQANKLNVSTFYDVRAVEKDRTARVHFTTHGIQRMVEWANTKRGGKVHDPQAIMSDEQLEMCSSIYGLCETAV